MRAVTAPTRDAGVKWNVCANIRISSGSGLVISRLHRPSKDTSMAWQGLPLWPKETRGIVTVGKGLLRAKEKNLPSLCACKVTPSRGGESSRPTPGRTACIHRCSPSMRTQFSFVRYDPFAVASHSTLVPLAVWVSLQPTDRSSGCSLPVVGTTLTLQARAPKWLWDWAQETL